MHQVFTAENYFQAQEIKRLLEENGISCLAKGETSVGSGLAAGELPPALVKNTLHVFEDADVSKAKELINEYLDYSGLEADWTCSDCGEHVEKEFSVCWNCGNSSEQAS